MSRSSARAPTVTHDYTRRSWGHDFTIMRIEDKGQRLGVSGWGHGIEEGHFLILPNRDKSTRYRVDKITYYSDPPDMWTADLSFAPRMPEKPL